VIKGNLNKELIQKISEFEKLSEKMELLQKGIINKEEFYEKKIKELNSKYIQLKEINNNKYHNDFVDLKLIICENIESKIYYKLLNLKLAPLFNNNIPYYVFFDGFYHIQRNTIITMQDLENNKNSKERLVAVSEPELERNNETYSIPFKNYFAYQNSQGYIISKMSSFNLSKKLYKIYMISKKNNNISKKKDERRISQILVREDEEEFQTSINKKAENIQLMEENASVSSQTSSINSAGISSLGIRNKKKENTYEYG
jgi:hypothetical protein